MLKKIRNDDLPKTTTWYDGRTFLGEFFLVIPEDKRGKEFRNVMVKREMTEENLLKVRAELEDEGGVFHEVAIRK